MAQKLSHLINVVFPLKLCRQFEHFTPIRRFFGRYLNLVGEKIQNLDVRGQIRVDVDVLQQIHPDQTEIASDARADIQTFRRNDFFIAFGPNDVRGTVLE